MSYALSGHLRELNFLLYRVLGADQLSRYPRFSEQSRDTYEAVLDLALRLSEEKFFPHWQRSDREEPHLVDGKVVLLPEVKEALDAYAQAGFLSMQADESQGGMQLPYTVALACDSLFAGANISTSGYALLARGVANLLHAHGSPEQQRLFMEPILRGRFLGTMCLSEPQAGSSLADISTRAELAPEGHYLLRGSKMWISAGEHELSENIVHMVLAKIPGGPAGVKGISLFIVPRYLLNPDGSRGPANDVQLAGLNHKMGHRGIVNTVLSFGERGHCVGYLVGAPHQGLAQMFHMMNEARIGVGVGAIMSGFAGLRYSLQYAKERRQGRHPDQRDAASSPVPLIEHADVRRMLLQQKSYVEGAYCLALYAARLVDTQSNDSDAAAQREAGLLLDLLTPLVKAWSADYCVKANDVAIQVLGGYGYTREYPVEQHFRDNRLNPIHEGANGIQALDLLGRKAMQEKGAALGILARRLSATAKQADASADLAPLGAKLREALSLLLETTAQLGACLASGDLRLGLANAAHYLVLCGHTVIAWCWLQQALAAEQAIPGASPEDADYYRGKLQTCRYFFAYELPQIEPAARLLQSRERCTLDMRPEWF